MLQVWLDTDLADGREGQLVVEDVVGAFKGTGRSDAELWLGGFANKTERFQVEIKDIRVIRRKR